jgi:hypothetical protein
LAAETAGAEIHRATAVTGFEQLFGHAVYGNFPLMDPERI